MRESYGDVDIDPETYGLTVWDLDREFLHTDYADAGNATPRKMVLRDILGEMRDAYCRTAGIDYMHIQNAEEKRWIQRAVEGVNRTPEDDEKRHILGRLTRPKPSRASSIASTPAPNGSVSKVAKAPSPFSTPSSAMLPMPVWARSLSAWPTAAG